MPPFARKRASQYSSKEFLLLCLLAGSSTILSHEKCLRTTLQTLRVRGGSKSHVAMHTGTYISEQSSGACKSSSQPTKHNTWRSDVIIYGIAAVVQRGPVPKSPCFFACRYRLGADKMTSTVRFGVLASSNRASFQLGQTRQFNRAWSYRSTADANQTLHTSLSSCDTPCCRFLQHITVQAVQPPRCAIYDAVIDCAASLPAFRLPGHHHCNHFCV